MPKKGYKQTKGCRDKWKETMKNMGRFHEHSEWMKEHNPMKRPEVVAKMMGISNPAKRSEVREKISESHKGLKHTDLTISKMCEIHKNRFLNDPELYRGAENPNWKGGMKEMECECCKGEFSGYPGSHQRFCSRKCYILWQSLNIRGENHPLWKGGISFEPYGLEFNNYIREFVLRRDNYTCQCCKNNNALLMIHHINYDKNDNRKENLITLCNSCHSKTNYRREFWKDRLKNDVVKNKVSNIVSHGVQVSLDGF